MKFPKWRRGMRKREGLEVVAAVVIAIVAALGIAAIIATTAGIVLGWLFGG